MSEILKLPKTCIMNTILPVSKLSDVLEPSVLDAIKEITVLAIIKPTLLNVKIPESDLRQSSEIIVIKLVVQRLDNMFELLRGILKQIKYHCIFIIDYSGKYKLATCRFSPGIIDYDINVLKSIVVSCWIRLDYMSSYVHDALDKINTAISTQTNLNDMYNMIHSQVVDLKQCGTSRAHVQRLIENMIGKVKEKELQEILKHCTPYEYHKPLYKANRYRNVPKSSNYILVHDYEEVWYCFMHNDRIKKVIEGRQYASMTELLYRIDGSSW